MGHLVFVESTRAGIQALEIAQSLGHRVTLLRDGRFDLQYGAAERRRLQPFVHDAVPVADSQDPAALEHGLREAMRRAPVASVLTTLHLCVLATARAAQRLGLRATAAEGVQDAHDKARCRAALLAHGLPTVRHAVAESPAQALRAAETIGYPLVVKPTAGSGKVLARIVDDARALQAHLDAAAGQIEVLRREREEVTYRFVLEEVAQGPMYSAEVAASVHGERAALVFLRRKRARHNPVLEMGSTIPCGFDAAQFERAGDYVKRVTAALGLDLGLFHVEFIWTADGPRLIEVNPRAAGGAIPDLVRAATGVNLFELLVRLHAGERLGLAALPLRHAVSHTYIAARAHGCVREDLPPDWFAAFRPRLLEGHADIRPGQRLRPMDGNGDTYGVMRVRAPTPELAAQHSEQLRRDVQAALGLGLVEVEAG